MENVPLSSTNRKLASDIEKSVKKKNLRCCTVSLTRHQIIVKEERDVSIKKMKQVFAELQSCLMDQQVALLAEKGQSETRSNGTSAQVVEESRRPEEDDRCGCKNGRGAAG